MTSNIHTLPELVDLALRAPEIGAVNFNILRVVLLKIIAELNLQHKTAEWGSVENIAETGKGLDYENPPNNPILKRIADEREKKKSEIKEREKAESEERKKAESEEKEKSESEEKEKAESGGETAIQTWIKSKNDGVKSQETEKSTTEVEQPSYKSDGDINEKDPEKILVNVTIPTTSTDQRLNFHRVWEVNKLSKRVEGIEEEVTAIVNVIDELKHYKEGQVRKRKREKEEISKGEYTGEFISREEFEDTIEDLGEAISRVSNRTVEQKENCEAANRDILKEMHLKASYEDMKRCKDALNGKLKNLAVAVRNIQRLIKDVIYPTTCGTTKCMACERKAHLPLRLTIVEDKGRDANLESYEIDTGTQRVQDDTDASLKFTRTELRKINSTDDSIVEEKKSPEDILDAEKHTDKLDYPDYLIDIEAFDDVAKITKNFAPLKKIPDVMRRSNIFIPIIRPKKAPVTISIGSEKNSSLKTRHGGT